MKRAMGTGIAIVVVCLLLCGCASENKPPLDDSQFAHCMAKDLLDLIRDGATEEEKAEALQHIFAWYNLSLQQNPTFTDDEIEERMKYSYGSGGSFELERYMSDQSAKLLRDEGLLPFVDSHPLSPSHPKAEPPVGTVNLKKCIEEHLQNMTTDVDKEPPT
jgi:hypothetical protein